MNSQTSAKNPAVRVFVALDAEIAAFGLTPADRIGRQLERLGMDRARSAAEAGVVISAACLFGNSVLEALVGAAPGTILKDQTGRIAAIRQEVGQDRSDALGQPAPAGARSGTGLAGRYDKKLRKRSDPMAFRPSNVGEAEQALFDASYKGVTDFVTKHVWPVPALAATRFCAARRITPNQVTWASAVLVGVTFWLFWIGAFLPGLVAAYAMTFLDTVDGKLARVTMQSSRLGDVLDHGIDLIHPPFWWWAWAVGCTAAGMPLDDGGLALGCIVAGYVLQRAEEGFFIARFGIEMHIWERFDSHFRKITARRNPNLVILTLFALLGAPREGLIAVALWTVLSLIVHLIRIVQAGVAARRGPLGSWLAAE